MEGEAASRTCIHVALIPDLERRVWHPETEHDTAYMLAVMGLFRHHYSVSVASVAITGTPGFSIYRRLCGELRSDPHGEQVPEEEEQQGCSGTKAIWAFGPGK